MPGLPGAAAPRRLLPVWLVLAHGAAAVGAEAPLAAEVRPHLQQPQPQPQLMRREQTAGAAADPQLLLDMMASPQIALQEPAEELRRMAPEVHKDIAAKVQAGTLASAHSWKALVDASQAAASDQVPVIQTPTSGLGSVPKPPAPAMVSLGLPSATPAPTPAPALAPLASGNRTVDPPSPLPAPPPLFRYTSGAADTGPKARVRPSKVLFVVSTTADKYDSRIQWILNTWGKNLRKEQLIIIGDQQARRDQYDLRHRFLHVTNCPNLTEWFGNCCRYAEAALLAHRMMALFRGQYEWAYFTNDQSFVRPDEMDDMFRLNHEKDQGSNGTVLGTFGCRTSRCKDGLCQEGGYAASRNALAKLVTENSTAFIDEQITACCGCAGWSSVALAQIIKRHGIQTKRFDGLFPWRLKKPCFELSLIPWRFEPVAYQNITSEKQMNFLQQIFYSPPPPPGDLLLPVPAESLRCVTYKRSRRCSDSFMDVPWDSSQRDMCVPPDFR